MTPVVILVAHPLSLTLDELTGPLAGKPATPADNPKQIRGYPPMNTPVTLPLHVIGCDVGKATVVAFDSRTGQTTDLPNRPDALKAFAGTLPRTCLVVCEATGGYEAALLLAVTEAGLPAHRADARKVKAFIRSLGRIAKTDAIDARGIARYGQERHALLGRWRPRDADLDDLQTLVRLRTRLVKQRAALTNQIKAPGGDIAKNRLRALVEVTTGQIDAIEDDIGGLIDRQPAIARVVAIIHDIPGCGPVTAATVAALMPELGDMTGKQAASLAGLAPHPHQSGRRDGYRRTRGGRPEIKRALFMAAMAARKHNPDLAKVYKRLVENGKKPIVAITAIMRKLITIINARVRDAIKANAEQLS
jgi:transposase